ncbi:MAG: 6-phosphofructokinase [Pontiellaceae bacterium]|nr:6-phosphofructokinase [Pontiellaceae bacterium]MBN2785392.1 6-phosphofructokinase [Pontiellaceae bacterium]
MATKTKTIGILTSGGDCPGLNAAIRGVAKAALQQGTKVIGVLDGFRGLVENRTMALEDKDVSGILTHGGTFLGSSRDKPHKMSMGGKIMDMTEVAVANAKKNHIDCLVCLGGNGTQKNAMRLHEAGLDVLTLPKTIDNDVAMTEITFGFDSSMAIATEAIDRLHTTASSHHRAIVCEIMGHKAGWLALGAGIAGGADVILIPEIPYDLDCVVEHLMARRHHNKRFSIIAVAEGAVSKKDAQNGKKKKEPLQKEKDGVVLIEEPVASRVAREIQQAAGIEVRFTSLGHVQRGGTPTATDRLLCTRLGTKAGELLAEGTYNVMVGVRGDECVAVPLADVAGKTKLVPPDHAWLKTAALVDTCIGEKF